jgi:hypothetical protein
LSKQAVCVSGLLPRHVAAHPGAWTSVVISESEVGGKSSSRRPIAMTCGPEAREPPYFCGAT